MLNLVGLSAEASRLGGSATFVQQRKVEIARHSSFGRHCSCSTNPPPV